MDKTVERVYVLACSHAAHETTTTDAVRHLLDVADNDPAVLYGAYEEAYGIWASEVTDDPDGPNPYGIRAIELLGMALEESWSPSSG